MVDHVEFINELIGKPYAYNAKGPDAYDCYHLVVHVQRELFGREFPDLEIPSEPSFKLIARMVDDKIRTSSEFKNWILADQRTADVGSVVLLGGALRMSHLGVYFPQDRSILHVDKPDGVMYQEVVTLRNQVWPRMTFWRCL
jgi:cell wall-associated NlpC family hydrolase